MLKVDYSTLDMYSRAEVQEFNNEMEKFFASEKTLIPSKEAVAYFYLTLNKLENEKGDEKEKSFYAWLQYDDIKHLEGKILTIIDAAIGELKQNKAIKDIIRRTIWFDWSASLEKVDPEMGQSMPRLEE